MRLNLVHLCGIAIAVASVLVTSAGPAFAGVTPVAAPEIDGNTVLAGIGLVGAGALLLRARRRSK